ncbi:hypothetical protein INR49_005488 [Caranx melampygus]|nr:hypothetical protein INR49_005488 [Caranx melampygus]
MKSAVVSSAAAQEETDGRPLPPGWKSYTSPEGQRYYVNSCSKETTWRRPSSLSSSSSSAEAPQRPLARHHSSPYEVVSFGKKEASQGCQGSRWECGEHWGPTDQDKPGPGTAAV